MINDYELSIEVSEPYDLNDHSLSIIEQNVWVKNQWPLVYFLYNDAIKKAYVGESTNASSRIKNHLQNPKKQIFNKIFIIGSDKFNKSATLDIESKLIQYLNSEQSYKLDNGNQGLINHNYYQQDLYKYLFIEIWNKLISKKIVTKSLKDIENSEVFKYSPYKSLNEDQYISVLEILNVFKNNKTNKIFVSGSAGTGKTILATYLIKLFSSDFDENNFDDYNEDELIEINYVKSFKLKYPNPKIGLVVAMASLRETLQKVFNQIPGLKSSMILSPSDTFKLKEKYDLLIVDEAHRLRKYKNISWMGAFKKNNEKLNLGDEGTELDWILANSKNQIFFYDKAQSVKPSDVDELRFQELLNKEDTIKLELKSQMRVSGGNNYIQFVNDLLNVNLNLNTTEKYYDKSYELKLFDSFVDLHHELQKKEKQFGLCRMVAGYSWPWLSDPRKNPSPNTTDIELDGMKFKWNSTMNDWINTPNAFNEIGCIHTTQGYDLNYTAVIFGKEINFNKEKNCIEIDSSKYFDINGKKGVTDTNSLKQYIINIYKTIMYRGIKGTYIYAYNKDLREYLKQFIQSHNSNNILPFRILNENEVKPYVNALPLVDIKAAAGSFSDLQIHTDLNWVEPPFNISAKPGYFICQVIGESMNKKIPNGSYCLFRKDEGGSREGKIVLVQSTSIKDSEFGSGYTVKEYHSSKKSVDDSWVHDTIILKPLSDMSQYEDIILVKDELQDFEVVGIFEKILI